MSNRLQDNSSRQKILVVGPCESGKSILSNVLAEAAEAASELYRPTVGVRILETDIEIRTTSQRVTVELWDLSGDSKEAAKRCWPAVKQDAVGTVLVYNPEKTNHEQEIEEWFQWFPKKMGLSANQVMVIQSLRGSSSRRIPLPAKLSSMGISQPVVVTAEDITSVRKHFATYLETVRQCVLDKQRQEEEDVMKGG
mmetsp:Transcript_64559/g.138406  ORF Transcript_64559/g.138406 Transcript_64559/m.138406 type:complete len:196 (-) Transcript_64559:52-639(-)